MNENTEFGEHYVIWKVRMFEETFPLGGDMCYVFERNEGFFNYVQLRQKHSCLSFIKFFVSKWSGRKFPFAENRWNYVIVFTHGEKNFTVICSRCVMCLHFKLCGRKNSKWSFSVEQWRELYGCCSSIYFLSETERRLPTPSAICKEAFWTFPDLIPIPCYSQLMDKFGWMELEGVRGTFWSIVKRVIRGPVILLTSDIIINFLKNQSKSKQKLGQSFLGV